MSFRKLLRSLVLCCTFAAAAWGAFPEGQPSWPLQRQPGPDGDPRQDHATFPRSTVAPQAPQRRVQAPLPVLVPLGENDWALRGGWRLRSVLEVPDTIREISQPGYRTEGWLEATVPGTVLTSLVDQGVYPEPTYGLNNLAIPESLARQDWWYRVEFTPPAGSEARGLTLCFKGINYAAEVWLNGEKLGDIRGAFRRGVFDLGGRLKRGCANALAVRISPPPHPGIPHEESLAAGAGAPNGGSLCLDGPTFFCTEGWDWIPGIRDRCAGIWQDLVLHAGGPVVLGDAHIKTELLLPDTSTATVFLSTAVENHSAVEQRFTVRAEFEGVRIEREAVLPAQGKGYVRFDASEFPALRLHNPRLWWPNGYGRPELYHLSFRVLDASGKVLEERSHRFGVRQLSYELSAFDPAGTVRRFEFTPSRVWDKLIVDKRHQALHPSGEVWLPTLAPGALGSDGVRSLETGPTAPFLVLRVNGVPIVCKGGNWGLDEALKRCSREKLEPYFRLQRDAHFTMVRNWCGQNTEEVFFDLADEYGLMVWSDFWLSTQEWNQQPSDLGLFLDNAEDVICRFRNHPSIVLWCGRNEGVPPPALNEGLDELVRRHDSSRYYQPGSRDINLLNSGPWVYGDPALFFNRHGLGFTTELGLPNVPTAEAMRAMMPAADLWPISDTWAYHDWHQKHHGEVAPFMEALARQYGPGRDLEDFCRKAQMLNYVSHRALFEGLNARLWKPASGRLMWMSHPAWPSTEWQLYTSDYDTNAAYDGARKACEPLHVQLNADDGRVVAVNTTSESLAGVQVRATLHDLRGRQLGEQKTQLDLPANTSQACLVLDAGPAASESLYFVKLTLRDLQGRLLSDNFYWQARKPEDHQLLNTLAKTTLEGRAVLEAGRRLSLVLRNPSAVPALLVRAGVRDAEGRRLLPVPSSEGSFSLLPGEERLVEFELPDGPARADRVLVEGWNLAPLSVPLEHP